MKNGPDGVRVRRNSTGKIGLTAADLAKELDISSMTVSLVINEKPGPSEETRKRVLALAARRGYRPQMAARSLALRRDGNMHSGVVAVFVRPGDERLTPLIDAIQNQQKVALVMQVILPDHGLDLCNGHQPDLVINLLNEELQAIKGRNLRVLEGGVRKGSATLCEEVQAALKAL